MTYVWDASALVHAARADRLDVLGDLASALDDGEPVHVLTAAVLQEVRSLGV